MSPIGPAGNLRLTQQLRSRLRPLFVLLLMAIALSAPMAFLILGLQETRQQAGVIAAQVAELINREASNNPTLWKYNTPKLVDHLRAYRTQPKVRSIEVADAGGARIDTGARTEDSLSSLWASSPIFFDRNEVGRVWVAVSAGWVYQGTFWLFLMFTGLGLCLAWLLYRIPLSTVSAAEERIGALLLELRQSRQAVEDLNRGLEHQVVARSVQLGEAYRDLQTKDRRLRELSNRSIQLQEQERRTLARDLHDAVGQALTALRINLQVLSERGPVDADSGRILDKSLHLVDEALDEVRRVVAQLGPAILDEIGLESALRRYADDFAERTGIPVHLEWSGVPSKLPSALESACYRIFQEALTNVAKHSGAKEVKVRLESADGNLSIAVTDDGRGFPAEHLDHGGGRGLAGIRERVALLQGVLQLDSSPGQGTRLRAELPLGLDRGAEPAKDNETGRSGWEPAGNSRSG